MLGGVRSGALGLREVAFSSRGNLTGLAVETQTLLGKHLELLKEVERQTPTVKSDNR